MLTHGLTSGLFRALGSRSREVINGLPAKVFGVVPINLSTNLQLDQVITWARPARAQSYDVWIGPNAGELVQVGDEQAARAYVPTLALDSTYYLRIDSINRFGTTTGDVISFSTWASTDVLLDQDDDPITDENGEYIDTREAFPFLTGGGDNLVTSSGDRLILLRA